MGNLSLFFFSLSLSLLLFLSYGGVSGDNVGEGVMRGGGGGVKVNPRRWWG